MAQQSSTGWSSKGPTFTPQHPHGGSHNKSLKKKSTTVTLLGQHSSLLHPASYPQTAGRCSHLRHQSSFSAANGDHRRKPQLDTKQRPTDPGEPGPSDYIDITTPVSVLRERHKRGSKSIGRARVPGSLLLNSLFQKWLRKQDQNNGNINRCEHGRETTSQSPTLDKELMATNDQATNGRGRISLAQA